jgi:hypothetical protein
VGRQGEAATVEREVPLASLVGWGATNLGIDLNFGRTPTLALKLMAVVTLTVVVVPRSTTNMLCVAGVPGLFFATRRASEVSDVLLRTLRLMRDERERETASAPSPAEEAEAGDEAQVTISIEPVRPVPPYAGTKY